MVYTQVELTSKMGDQQVWWIPVPEGKAKAGEVLYHDGEPWTITGVYTTLHMRAVPAGARIAKYFKRESNQFMSF